MPTISLINDSSALPAGLAAEVGDEAFVRDNSVRYRFVDLSQVSSQSFSFDSNVGVLHDASVTSSFESDGKFSLSYWTYLAKQTSSPILSFNQDSSQVEVSFTNRGTSDVDGTIDSGHRVYPTSPFLASSFPVRSPDSAEIPNDGSIWSGDSGVVTINKLRGNSSSFDSAVKVPFTIQSFQKDVSSFSGNDRGVNQKDNWGLVSIDGVIRVSSQEVIWQGVKHRPQNDSNSDLQTQIVSERSAQDWAHNGVIHDSNSNLKLYRSEVAYDLVHDERYSHDAGELSIDDFRTDRDAAFKVQAYFPGGTGGADAVLFTLGSNPGDKTEIRHDASSGQIEVVCRQLSGSFNASSLFTGQFRDVAWEIQINPARFSLYVDGIKKLELTNINPLTNYRWAEGAGTGIANIGVTNSADVTYQPNHYNSVKAAYNNLIDATRVENGNVFVNTSLNDARTYFKVNTVIPVGSNKFYYWENRWTGNNLYSDGKYWTYGYNYIVDARWNGQAQGTNQVGPRVISNDDLRGEYLNPNTTVSNPSDPHEGELMKRLDVYTSFLYERSGYHYSYIFDVSNGICYSIMRGLMSGTTYIRTMPNLHAAALGYTPGVSNGGDPALDNPGYNIAFNEHRWIYTSASDGRETNQGRWIRKGDGEADVGLILNPDSWKYRPLKMLKRLKQLIDGNPALSAWNGAFSGQPSGYTYDITNAGIEGAYASAAPHISPWYTISGYPKLKYFPQKLKGLSSSPMKIGTGRVSINPLSEHGSDYANKYVAKTGGTIRTVSEGTYPDLSYYIRTVVQDGDCLLLQPGTYSIGIDDGQGSNDYFEQITDYNRFLSTPFFKKKFLICGNTDVPSSVHINWYPYGYNTSTPITYHYVRAPFFGKNADDRNGLAFLSMKRFFGSYYQDAVSIFFDDKGAKAEKVIFDLGSKETYPYTTYYHLTMSYDEVERFYNNIYAGKPFRTLRDCHFKNYGEFRDNRNKDITGSSSYTVGHTIYIENLAFENEDVRTQLHNNNFDSNGYLIDEVTFDDSNTAHDVNFRGYTHSFNVKPRSYAGIYSRPNTFQSDKAEVLSLIDQDSNVVLLDARHPPLELLKIDDRGIITTSTDNGISSIQATQPNFNVDQWTFNTLEWDPSTNIATLSVNGESGGEISNFLDSVYINQTKMLIGGEVHFNSSTNPHFTHKFFAEPNVVKDLKLQTDDSFSSIPFTVPNLEPDEKPETVIITGLSSIDPSIQTTIGTGTLTFQEFSPFTGEERDWKKIGVVRPTYHDVAIINPFTDAVYGTGTDPGRAPEGDEGVGRLSDDLHHGADSVGLTKEVFAAYDSDFLTGVSDSSNSLFDVEVVLAERDANNKLLQWRHEINNVERTAIVGKDSSGYRFIIRKIDRDYTKATRPTAMVRFIPSFASGIDDSNFPAGPQTSYMQNVSGTIGIEHIDVNYDRFGADINRTGLFQNVSRFVEVRPLPIDRNPSMYTYDSEPASRFNPKLALVEFDSIGALPL